MNIITRTNLTNTRSLKIEDAHQAISLRKVKTPNYRYIMHRLAGFSAEEYTDMEYDLSETARIIDTESLVAAAFRKKRQLILKDGFELASKNDKNLNYIKQRLYEFEFVTSQSFSDFLSEVTENLVNFNNCFILKFRKEESSSGKIRELPSGKEFKPIAGLFVLAAPTIDTATNSKTGQIVKYRHRITEQFSKQFKVDDIYHIYENKRVGITIGTPPLESVKDDIIALRSIEQSAETMIYKHANPFIHVKVGTDAAPARLLGDGSSEVDVYSEIIERMDETGGVATPHRVSIDLKGAESQALRLESYLNHFKQRVLSGLCISEADLGSTGSASGSADIAYESMRDDVRAYQATISNYISNYIFYEMLLESPMYVGKHWIPYEERVELIFTESDIDKRIKIESHYLLLYNSGLISKEAAGRFMQFENSDLNHEVDFNGNPKNNSIKNTISNNIIEPKNQHNSLKIMDSLLELESLTTDLYFSYDYDEFKENILKIFPEDMLITYESLIKKVYNKAKDITKDYGIRYSNTYIEKILFDLLLNI